MTVRKKKRLFLAKQVSWIDIQLLLLRSRLKLMAAQLTLSRLVLPIFIIATVLIFLAHRQWFGNPTIPTNVTDLYFGIGTVTGAMLAIVFAFSSQLVARASEALPTRYFKLFARDTWLDLIYLVIGLITTLEFILGVISLNNYGQMNTLLIRLGIWLMLLTIILLYYCYVRLIKILGHEYQIKWLIKYTNRYINELNYLASRQANAAVRGYKNTSKDKLLVEGGIYEGFKNQIDAITDNLDGFIEMYFSYKSKGDNNAAHHYIHLISGTIMSYILSRQNNSLLEINATTGLTYVSSLSSFVQTNLEKAKIIWDKAISENDIYAIRKYLRDIQGIVRASLMVNYIQRPNENPVFVNAYYNLGQLIKESIKVKNLDALFEMAFVLEQIAEIAVKKNYYVDALDQILDDFKRICIASAINDDMGSVTYNVVKNLLKVCQHALSQEEINEKRLRKMQEIVPMCLATAAVTNGNDILIDIEAGHFGDNIFAIATYGIGKRPNEKQIGKIIQTSKLTLSILRKLAPIAIGGRHGTQWFNRSVTVMIGILADILNDNIATDQQIKDVHLILNDLAALPTDFPNPDKIVLFNNIDDYIDRFIQAAIILIQKNQIDEATNIFDAIIGYLNKALQYKGSKVLIHDLLRTVNDTKLIGATARKLKKQKLQKHVSETIKEFERAYHNIYFPDYPKGIDPKASYSPSPNFLRKSNDIDIFGYSNTGLPSYFHDAKALFLEAYSESDLDGFEDYLWK